MSAIFRVGIQFPSCWAVVPNKFMCWNLVSKTLGCGFQNLFVLVFNFQVVGRWFPSNFCDGVWFPSCWAVVFNIFCVGFQFPRCRIVAFSIFLCWRSNSPLLKSSRHNGLSAFRAEKSSGEVVCQHLVMKKLPAKWFVSISCWKFFRRNGLSASLAEKSSGEVVCQHFVLKNLPAKLFAHS